MALWFNLKVNSTDIGFFCAQRQEKVIPDDRICTYHVDVEHGLDTHKYVITHNFDDGALALVHAALTHHLADCPHSSTDRAESF